MEGEMRNDRRGCGAKRAFLGEVQVISVMQLSTRKIQQQDPVVVDLPNRRGNRKKKKKK